VQKLPREVVAGRRWPVLALLPEAGAPMSLRADLFAVHGPDSAHIYRHEPAVDNTPWPDGEAVAVPVGATGRPAG
jgi:hypothetical protein